MNVRFITLVTLVALAALLSIPVAGEATGSTESVDLVYTAADFELGLRDNLVVTTRGLTLTPPAIMGRYLSPVIRTPISFNAFVPHWLADVPYGTSIQIELRTGTTGGSWDDWYQIYENDDWMEPGDQEAIGQMIAVPASDVTHDKLQFAVYFRRYFQSSSAILKSVRLTLIDSTFGPTAEEMLELVSELEGANVPGSGYPKPPVIPRSIWCTDPACNYSDGLEYESVTHLIVHHTVSSNSSSDWAAIVRAIWHYHTFSRSWGDIGYNYLVDMNGVLYEGHNGGDDVVGTHAAGANEGSMALSFIGTFTEPYQSPPGITPPSAMRNSAVELFAWKADQKNIDVFSASHLPNVDWGLPHLMGHRDVYGTTVCPGDQAHDLLPWLRNEVANRIGFVSPHIYVDEESGAFTKSNSPHWYTPPGGCGFNGHSYYTWSVTDPGSSSNWGEWRPPLNDSGVYKVEVYAPYCITGRAETDGATYTISHSNGTSTVSVSHEENVGTWMSLGTYYFNAGNSGVIRLTDLTSTDSGLGVWFDAIRLRPLDPNLIPVLHNTSPSADEWLQYRTVNFQWDVINASTVQSTKLRVATDPNLVNVVLSETFSGARSSYTHAFTADYERLYWRVEMTTYENHTAGSDITWFGIDTVLPVSQVQGIVKVGDSHYGLHWLGVDQTSGIASYLVEYQAEGDSQWQTLLSDTTRTSMAFFPPDERVYWFRTQATDAAGHTEPIHSSGDMSTDQAVQLSRAIIFPLIFR
jgi:hypothetical protein